jgi:hypothetical protein
MNSEKNKNIPPAIISIKVNIFPIVHPTLHVTIPYLKIIDA